MRGRTKSLSIALGVAALFAASPSAGAGARPHVYLDQSWRLPAYTEPAGTSTTDTDLVDVDKDGDLDLFLSEGTAGADPRPNKLLINTGFGFFKDESLSRLPARVDNSSKTSWADLDGDGDLDGLTANAGPEMLMLNNGRGVFADGSAQLPAPLPIFDDVTIDIALVDVDGDRDLDALLSNENPFTPGPENGAQDRLWLNDGHARFTDVTTTQLPVEKRQTTQMLPGDVDKDGDQDLIVLNRGPERVLLNDGHGAFTDSTDGRFPVTEDFSRAGALADFDRDGDLDVLVSNSHGDPITQYANDGHGRFTPVTVNVPTTPDDSRAGMVVADFDRDGDLDAYFANVGKSLDNTGHNFAGGVDTYLLNDGRGRFTDAGATHFLPALAKDATTAVGAGDLDRDGDLDLVTGNSGDTAPAEKVYTQLSWR